MAIKKCRECGEAVSTEAKACPKCGVSHPTETGVDTLLRAVGTVIIGGLVGDFIFGWGLFFSPHKAFIPPPVHFSASQPVPDAKVYQSAGTTAPAEGKSSYSFSDLGGILDVYSSNQALFYSAVKGKRMRAVAPYKALSKSLFSDDEYSLLAGDRPFTDIQCRVPAATAISQLSSLNKGDTITMDGIVSDVIFGTLVLTSCTITR
jgi:hypothetical protein